MESIMKSNYWQRTMDAGWEFLGIYLKFLRDLLLACHMYLRPFESTQLPLGNSDNSHVDMLCSKVEHELSPIAVERGKKVSRRYGAVEMLTG